MVARGFYDELYITKVCWTAGTHVLSNKPNMCFMQFWFTADEIISSLTLNDYVRMSFVRPIPNNMRTTSIINNENAGDGNFYTALDVCSE